MGKRKRSLPESAYDFWVRDGRDGEVTPRRDTLAEARSDLAIVRHGEDSWSRCCWEIKWEVNERKVKRMLDALRQIADQGPQQRPWINPRLIARQALDEPSKRRAP